MAKNLEIRINEDQKCTKCGKGGTVESSGICLDCTSKIITGKFEGHVKGLRGQSQSKIRADGEGVLNVRQ